MLPRIESPTWDLEVPSTKDKVKMRLMKVSDEKLLLMAKEGDDPGEILTAVKQVVNNCIVQRGSGDYKPQDQKGEYKHQDIDEWAIFDIEYAFLQLRAHSVSDTAEVSYIDNEEVDNTMSEWEFTSSQPIDVSKREVEMKKAQTAATRTFKIDLKNVKVKFPDKTESQIKINNKVGIHLKYPPASLYSDKEFLGATGDELVNLLITSSIETIYDGNVISYDKTHPAQPNELREFIEGLDVKVYNKIKEFFNDLPHLEHKIEYINKNGKDRVITLTTLGDFFQF